MSNDRRYERVVFDVDGTLIDSKDAIANGIASFMRSRGFSADLGAINACFGKTPKDVFSALGVGHLYKDINNYVNHYVYKENPPPLFPGVLEILESLKAKGIPMAVCTSRSRHEFDLDTVFLKISDYFELVMTNEYANRPKPAPDPLLKYMRETNTCPESILYVGDSDTDYFCTKAAGVDFALALWGTDNYSMAATYKLFTPSDLAKFILLKEKD